MKTNDHPMELVRLIADLREKEALAGVQDLLSRGHAPLKVYDLCYQGMSEVGLRYESGEYALAGLIMAGEILDRIGLVLLPMLKEKINQGRAVGRIVLGTVAGDIHNLGKDIFKTLVRGHGYAVHDLGVDVPAARFLAAIHEFKPDIVGLSCLINTAYHSMEETIHFLRENVPAEVAPRAYLIGGRVDPMVLDLVDADYWTNNAVEGVKLCKKILADD